MRIILYILTFLVFTFVSAIGPADKLVEQGVKSYQSKHYTQALSVLNQAIESEDLAKAEASDKPTSSPEAQSDLSSLDWLTKLGSQNLHSK